MHARSKLLSFAIVLRIFRLLLRPLLKACKQTRESVICTKRQEAALRCEIHHRTVVKIARSSGTLMCSGWPVQAQPAIVFHFQSLEGKDARRRWYLTCWSDVACRRRFSPFIETKPASFRTKPMPCTSGTTRLRLMGGASEGHPTLRACKPAQFVED